MPKGQGWEPACDCGAEPAPAPEPPLSSAWLIERSRPGSGPVWWAAKQYDVSVPDLWHFSPDANHAVRFSRREDAEAVMRALGGSVELHESTVRVTEHIWLGARVSERPAPNETDRGVCVCASPRLAGVVCTICGHIRVGSPPQTESTKPNLKEQI